jgi:hypothetical protein
MHARRIACFILGFWLGGAALAESRSLAQSWGMAQVLGGIAFLLFLVFGTREGKYTLLTALLLLATAVVQMSVRIAPVNQGAEVVKWALILGLAARFFVRRGRSGDAREDLDLVNKADHRHVNR